MYEALKKLAQYPDAIPDRLQYKVDQVTESAFNTAKAAPDTLRRYNQIYKLTTPNKWKRVLYSGLTGPLPPLYENFLFRLQSYPSYTAWQQNKQSQ